MKILEEESASLLETRTNKICPLRSTRPRGRCALSACDSLITSPILLLGVIFITMCLLHPHPFILSHPLTLLPHFFSKLLTCRDFCLHKALKKSIFLLILSTCGAVYSLFTNSLWLLVYWRCFYDVYPARPHKCVHKGKSVFLWLSLWHTS